MWLQAFIGKNQDSRYNFHFGDYIMGFNVQVGKGVLLAAVLLCGAVASISAVNSGSKEDTLELSGDSASFFSNYVVPLPGLRKSIPGDYQVFYGKDDGKRITLLIKAVRISQSEFFSSPTSHDVPSLTKAALVSEYCRPRSNEAVLPNSREGMFITARENGKILQLSYYDNAGESLFFSVSLGPESCKNFKPALPHSRVDLVNQRSYPEQVITRYGRTSIMNNSITNIAV